MSCDKFSYPEYEGNPNNFNVKKYKNFIVIYKIHDTWSDRDFYIFKNDSIVIKIIVPQSFSKIYSIGDTIK